jgi:hypothetical protein
MIFYQCIVCKWEAIDSGMSSVLAGIPSFKDAFTSSLSKQKLNPGINLGRRRVQHFFFFHGAVMVLWDFRVQ